MKKMKEGIFFFKPNLDESRSIPLTSNSISAGFPSPADDFKEIRISLDKEIIKNEEATFYARVDGESMQGAGLSDGVDGWRLPETIYSKPCEIPSQAHHRPETLVSKRSRHPSKIHHAIWIQLFPPQVSPKQHGTPQQPMFVEISF